MRQFILPFFLASASVALADEPSSSAISTSTSNDLVFYKTADVLWDHLNSLVHQLAIAVSSQDPKAKDFVPLIAATADSLTSQFPRDAHFWDAKMIKARAGDKATRNKLATAPTPVELAREFTEIADSSEAPRPLRAEAASSLIEQAMDEASDAKGDASARWDAVDASIVRFQKKYGDVLLDGSDSPAIDLREEEVDALETSSQPARFQALLQQLAIDPQPRIAAMAKRKLAAEKQLAVLQARPIDLKFTAVDGAKIDLAQMRGKVVLIDFWATWCPDCRIDTPDVVSAYRKFHARGFEIVGVSLDKDRAKMLAYIKRNGMPWPQYFDGKVWSNDISKSFNIDFIPAAWLIDRHGMLVTTNGSDHLADKVEKTLATP